MARPVFASKIGHVVEAYESSLSDLVDPIYREKPHESVPEDTDSWADFTRDITVFKLEDAMAYMQERLKKYLPPTG